MTNTRSRIAAVLFASSLGACSGVEARPDVRSADASMCPPDSAMPPRTLVFVVTTLDVDQANGQVTDNPDRPHTGFDLDRHPSGPTDPEGCNHEDFFSTLDVDQNRRGLPCSQAGCGGVDNMLPTVVGTIQGFVDPAIHYELELPRQIRSGERVILLRLSGVDDLETDCAIELEMLAAFDADADCANNLDGRGRFVVDTRSYVEGDSRRPRWRARGSIVGGRVRTEPFESVVPAPLGYRIVEVAAHATQIRFNLSRSLDGGAGNWGGWVDGREMLDAWSAEVPHRVDQMSQVFPGLVDVQVDGVCADGTGASLRLGGISFGLGFGVAPAEVVGEAAAPAPNACGRPMGDAGRD